MQYKILARKWRPQTFKEVCGQKYVLKSICNSLNTKTIHHTWLFSGTRGSGKTTIARILAKSLNCKKSITSNPCRQCKNCKKLEKGFFPDFIEIDGASRTKVEETKELLSTVHYYPIYGRFKIYLIDEVHMLSKHSFNALLKILEEPPTYVKFILATTEIEKIPKTIISRCLIYKLSQLQTVEMCKFISKILKKEKVVIDKEALETISIYSMGSMRDVLNIVEQAISINNSFISKKLIFNLLGVFEKNILLKVFNFIIQKETQSLIKFLNKYSVFDINWDFLLIEMLKIIHYLSIMKFCPNITKYDTNICYSKKDFTFLSKSFSFKKLNKIYKTIVYGRSIMKFCPNKKIGSEMIFLQIINDI